MEDKEKLDAKIEELKEMEKKGKVDSPLEEAKKINIEKAELLKREEDLQTRKEKFQAEVEVGGRAEAGEPQTPEDKEKVEANDRVMEIGRAGGAAWAQPKS